MQPGYIDEPMPFNKETVFDVALVSRLLNELMKVQGFKYECSKDPIDDVYRARAYVGDINMDEYFIDKDDRVASGKALLALKFELKRQDLLI